MIAPAQVVIDLYPAQDDFVHDARRYTAFIAGRNSGKTYAGSCKAVVLALRGGLGCIAAPSFPMLEHGAKAQFLQRLDQMGVRYRHTRSSVELPGYGAEVIFVTLESESRVRGPNYAWGWADEVEYVADRAIWRAFKGAIRSGDDPQLFVTSTPKGRRLVWDEWVVNPTPQHALYRATTFDNPFIDAPDYVAGLGYEGLFYQQEITADFVSFEGLVYPAFDRATHVRERDCGGWRTVLAVDVGTRNPTAILTIRFGADVDRHIQRERYQRGMSSDEIVDAICAEADLMGPERIFLDPSAAGYIESLRRRGYPAEKARNEIVYGIGVVTTALADGLTVDPSCVNTIVEFETYRYPDVGAASTKDVPVKEADHAMDAIRYGLVGIAGGSYDNLVAN